jgi:hypothetical protein
VNTLTNAEVELYAEVWKLFNSNRDSCSDLCKAVQEAVSSGKPQVARLLRNYAFVAYPRDPALIQLGAILGTDFDQQFYSRLQAGSESSAKIILKLVRDRYPFKSVVDFGAGVGVWLKTAHSLGASNLLGVDGLWAKNSERFSGSNYQFTDLNCPITDLGSHDLAICVEVAEHLEPSRSESFVSDLCRCADAVIFGAALPRQYGDGHINCRRQSFWISLFRSQGFACHDFFRPRIWYNSQVEPWYRQNTFLFTRRKVSALFHEFPEPTLLDVYQPQLLIDPVDHYVKRDHELGVPDPTGT